MRGRGLCRDLYFFHKSEDILHKEEMVRIFTIQNLIPKIALFLLTNPNFWLIIRTRSPKYGLAIGKRPLRRWHFRAVGELWFYQ